MFGAPWLLLTMVPDISEVHWKCSWFCRQNWLDADTKISTLILYKVTAKFLEEFWRVQVCMSLISLSNIFSSNRLQRLFDELWPRFSEFWTSPQLRYRETVRVWQRSARWHFVVLWGFFNLKKRKRACFYQRVFCSVQVTGSGSALPERAVLAHRLSQEGRVKSDWEGVSSPCKSHLFEAFLQPYMKIRKLVGQQNCHLCCLMDHNLGVHLSLLLLLSQTQSFSDTLCLVQRF